MSVVIQVDVQEARAQVAALNAEIMSIATSASSVKAAFGGDIAGDLMNQFRQIRTELDAIKSSASGIQSSLSGTASALNQTGTAGRSAASGVTAATQAVNQHTPAAARATAANGALRQTFGSLAVEAKSAQREVAVLVGELLRGNTGQFERSLVTLGRQLGIISFLMSGAGATFLAAVGFIGAFIAVTVSAQNEIANFNKALVITNNVSGETAAGFVQMANDVGASTGHWIDAKNAVEGLAAQGKLTGDSLRLVAQGVVSYSDLTGQSVEKSLELFNKLGDDPVRALIKLDQQWHFLDQTQRDHIQTLEDLGLKVEAGIEAEETFAKVTNDRDAQYKANLTGWAKLWSVISATIGEAVTKTGQFTSGTLDKISNLIQNTPGGQAGVQASQQSVGFALLGPLAPLLQYLATPDVQAAPKQAAANLNQATVAATGLNDVLKELTNTDVQHDAELQKQLATYKGGKTAIEEYRLGIDTLAIATAAAKKGSSAEEVAAAVQALYAQRQGVLDNAKAYDALVASKKLDKSITNELSSELGSIIGQFDKATQSSGDFGHQFDEIERITQALNSGGLDKELAKIGATATEARAALDWKAQEDTFSLLKNALADVNPLFKDLIDPTKDLKSESNDLGDAYAVVDQWVNQLTAKWPALSAAFHQMGEEMKTQIPGILDGSTKALQQFDANVRDQQKNLDAVFKVDGLDAFIQQAQEAGRTVDAISVGAQAYAAANVALGGSISSVQKALAGVTDAQQQENSLQQIWIDLQNDPVMQAAPERLAAYGRALQNVYNSTALGALQLSNTNIKNQIDLISQGSNNLTVYNELWKLTKGGILEVTPAMQQAAEAQAALNEQFAKMQEVQSTFKSFASSLGDAFGKFFTDTKHSFKSFTSDIKDAFKQLIEQMIAQAATNQILFYFGFNGQGAGGGGGSLGGIVGLFANLFGAGGGSSTGSGIDLSSLAGAAAVGNASVPGQQFYNLGYNPTGMEGGNAGGGGIVGGIQTANQLYQTGQFGYNLYSGGISSAFSQPLNQYSNLMYGRGAGYGSNFAGSFENVAGNNVWTPSGAGTALGIAGGLYAGYNRFQNGYNTGTGLAAGATYAVGTYAAGAGLASLAAGGGVAAGVSGGMAAVGMVPVVGWVALALMALDMVTGGGLFGTKASKYVGGATDYKYNDGSGDLSGHYTLKGKKPLFGGSYYKTQDMDITPDMQASADATTNAILNFGKAQAARLNVALATGIQGSFEAQFDKNGNITKQISTVLGKTYTEPLEDFVKRMKAETLVSEIGESIAAMGGNADEAQTIAERFRANASDFLDAAQFMEAAQIDIKNGTGLLREAGGAGVLTDTVDVVQQLQADGETLTQTYARLVAETQLVIDIVGVTGSTFTKSGKDFVQFSDDFVQAMGGLDQATASWNVFSQAILGGTSQITSATSSGALSGQLESLGLSADTTISQFADAFKHVAGSLDAQTLAQWVQAGAAMGTIQQTMEVLQGMADGVDISGLISQQSQLVASINMQISMAAKLGASEQQLAEMRKLGQQAIDKQLGDFMGNIEDQIEKIQGGDFAYQLRVIHEQMLQNIDSARALGASESDLAQIQKLAALQTAAVIAQLKNSIADLVKQLHGGTTRSGQSQLQQQANSGQQALLSAQKALYDAAQRAMKDIKQFLDSLKTGDLSPLDYHAQLDAAQSQFADLVTRAQHGDTDAMSQLTQAAQTYLQEAQGDYGNSAAYGQIFNNVTAILQQLQTQFAAIAPPPETTGGSNNGSGASDSSSLSTDDRAGLAIQIAQQIGALGLALNVSVFSLMDKYGVSTQELATDLGINIDHMSDETVNGLVILASALHVSTVDLLNSLGAQPAAIGAYFQVTVDQLNAGNFANVKAMADALGISVFDAITYVGGNLETTITSLGIDLGALTGGMVLQLGSISTTLGVSIFDLLTQLNVSVAAFASPLADAIRTDIAQIPDLASDTVTGLAPLLVELGTAITQGDLNKALGDINAYLATLPEDQRQKLEDLFTGLGINIDASTNAISDQTDTQTQTANNTMDMVTAQSFTNTTLSSMKTTGESQLAVLHSIGVAMGANVTAPPGGSGGGRGGGGRNNPGAGGRTQAAQQGQVNVFTVQGNATMTIPGATQMRVGTYNSQSQREVQAPIEQLHRTVRQQSQQQREQTRHSKDIADSLDEVNQRLSQLTGVVATKMDRSHEAQTATTGSVNALARTAKLSGKKRTAKS